ncbi:hypothetical protein [Sutcliffiella rhizosphaerae]|uniref:Uncharacterized protein n=1 Tax=Sutcliffiella rhizosphaerae TaxID=2880967 RepID=A0ABM8YQ15_9BACI|nr:hypothetical protein [Sutcliffiella rhizosphaerae]CAG9622097.1 hypothetical protein BACCIP111883_02888 [Sutcliffiella rhizosphaerae]
MIDTLKTILLLVAIMGQVVGIALLVLHVWIGVLFFILYAIAIIALFLVLIIERQKEKKEDEKNDYRNY